MMSLRLLLLTLHFSAAIGMDFSSPPRVILPEAHRDCETVLLKLGFEPTRTSRYFFRGQAAYSLG